MSTVIKVENISKQYRLGQVGTGSLAHDINRSWHKLRRKEDPYLKIGEENDRTVKGDSNYVWALKDINFNVQPGEVLGIIGHNGAGKSTLLKILSRTTTPTTGSIKIKGRIASLLEVGTGFHPELSGRENIFLNGAIMGMTRNEIKRKFDEIVDFAGVERYIDTPVKRYSSGMYVRLAFGVAAHLEPDILIVDEVLAVGDADFQRKALGKMKDVSGKEGRTVLFVSHNMAAMNQLCTEAILLKNGSIVDKGLPYNICRKYHSDINTNAKSQTTADHLKDLPKDPNIEILGLEIIQNGYNVQSQITNGEDLEISIKYKILQQTERLRIFIDIMDNNKELLIRSFHDEVSQNLILEKGIYESKVILPKNLLGPADYDLLIGATIHKVRTCFPEGIVQFPIKVLNTGIYNKSYPDDVFRSKLGLVLEWNTQQENEGES